MSIHWWGTFGLLLVFTYYVYSCSEHPHASLWVNIQFPFSVSGIAHLVTVGVSDFVGNCHVLYEPFHRESPQQCYGSCSHPTPLSTLDTVNLVSQTPKTVLSVSSDRGCPCLAPYLREGASSFPPLRTISHLDFFMLRWVRSVPTFRIVLIINGY